MRRYAEFKARYGGRNRTGWSRNDLIAFEAAYEALGAIVDLESGVHSVTRTDVMALHNLLARTPSNRRKLKLTRRLSMREAADMADQHDLPRLSPETIDEYLGMLSRAFADAVAEGLISGNPFRGVKATPRNHKSQRRAPFSAQDLQTIVNALATTSEPWRYATLLSIWLGARMEELLRLKGSDIRRDPASQIWCIHLCDDGGKSDFAPRAIPMPGALERVHLRRSRDSDRRDHVIPFVKVNGRSGWRGLLMKTSADG